ncbi:nuclear polyadenylated RNA-binding protein NAB2-like [Ctenocephalides felis]|uniref:nuclear polyadenylated RNA-binding protein NAB2-like n=1 Tax=Ctenocephalides felis TaxID=7515 RepID=UPI000E6E58B1|nr:nuclear polyadenylated RNA-binding protein NAB2-like [Ctenocephalides felis]
MFIDLQKAFDTVDHGILLNKLIDLGVEGLSYSIIKDFLMKRVTLVISELQPQLPQQQLQPQLPQQQLQPQIPQQQLQPQLPQQQLQPQLPQQQLPQQQQQQLPQQQLPQQQLPQQQQPQLPQQQMPDQPLCTGMNEEYGCRMTCDGRCDSFGSFCFNGVNKCQCYCRFGFYLSNIMTDDSTKVALRF